MITDYILAIPDETLLALMPAALQADIKSLGAEFPSFPQPGTQSVAGKKLLHVRMSQLIQKASLEGMFAAHGLDWTVLAIRSAYKDGMAVNTPVYITEYVADKAALIPYLNPVWVSETESRPVELSDTVFLSTYAGTEPIQL